MPRARACVLHHVAPFLPLRWAAPHTQSRPHHHLPFHHPFLFPRPDASGALHMQSSTQGGSAAEVGASAAAPACTEAAVPTPAARRRLCAPRRSSWMPSSAAIWPVPCCWRAYLRPHAWSAQQVSGRRRACAMRSMHSRKGKAGVLGGHVHAVAKAPRCPPQSQMHFCRQAALPAHNLL